MATNGKAPSPLTDWASNPRWAGVTRPYSPKDVERLRGSMQIEYTLARHGAERLWRSSAYSNRMWRLWAR